MDRGSETAPVQQEDRLPAALRYPPELLQERRRERISRLPTQIDDLHRRQRRGDPAAELEPLEACPRLGPRRRRAEHRDRTLERRTLRRHRACVVARVGLLLVRRIVLLVDADDAEGGHRREHGRAGTHDHTCLTGCDPLALVAALRLCQRGVQYRNGVAEANAEPPERLRRERDLGNEHDRPAPARERLLARADVHLRLAAARRSPEQHVAAAPVEQLDDAVERPRLHVREPRGGSLRCEGPRRRRRAPLAAPLRVVRGDESERARRGRAVVVGEPQREIDERGRQRPGDALDRRRLHALRRRDVDLGDDAAPSRVAEAHFDDRALLRLLGDLVGERPRDRACGDERIDGGVPAHRATVPGAMVGA